MQRSRGHLTLLAFGLVAVPTILSAQTASTSALSGTVRDTSGKALAGAVVRISSPSMIGGEKSTTTTENGSYRFSALPPGSYRITVSAAGHATRTQSEILELGRTSTVNWRLGSSSTGATVEVVGTVTKVDDAATTQTQNFDTAALATLPVERSISGIMNLTPGVNGVRAWGGYSGENAYMMDGINISDPSGGTQWIYPNVDWFSEVQVAGLGANAEYGGFMGGFVNGLVKRGGNTLEGSFNAYYSDSKWQSRLKVDHPDLTPADKDILPAKNWDVAFSVGGPLIKDKLWYFVSAERTEEDYNPPGAELPQRNQKVMALAKITWAPTPSSTLEFLSEYDYVGRDRRYIDRYTMPVATQKESAPNRSYSLTWTQTIGSDKVFTVKAFGYSGRYDQPGYGGNAYSLDTADLWQYDPNKPAREFFNNSTYEDFNYRGRATISATFDLFKTGLLTSGDSHAFRFGVEREQGSDEELQRFPGNLNLNALIDVDENNNPAIFGDYLIEGGGWNVRQRTDRLVVFAQDTWKVNDRLTITPGIRFEQFKGRFYGASPLWDKKTYAPRFGISYALTEDQGTMLKAHWGKYYAGYSTYFIDRAIQDAIPIKNYYSWGDYPLIPNALDPSTWPDHTPGTPDNYLYRRINDLTAVDPKARHPFTEEWTVSLDHKIDALWTVSASYVVRDFKDSLARVDTAIGQDTKGTWVTKWDPVGRKNIDVWKPGTYYDEALDISMERHSYLTTNPDDAKRKYTAATFAVDRKFSGNWSLSASYTLASLKGNIQRADSYDKVYYNPNLRINSYGNLPGVNDDEFKIRTVYELPWKMRLSATYTYLSGTHWTPTYRTDSYNGTRYQVNAAALGSSTYPYRSLLDFRVTQMVDITKSARAEFFVEVLNLLDRQAVTGYDTRVNSSTSLSTGQYIDYMYPTAVDPGRRLQLGIRVNF